MSLRFFADHCTPTSVITRLRAEGNEVILLRERIPKDSKDAIVITKAQELEAILVSLNGDFTDIVRYPPKNFRGIIALQVRDHPEAIASILNRLCEYFSRCPDAANYAGKLLLVEPHRIRTRY